MKNNLGLTIDTSQDHLTKEVQTPVAISYISVISTIIGLNYYCWNIGLESGFWEFIVALLVVWTGFVCQGLCMAELSGALPFTGGTYALTRVTLGPWLGFLTGVLEIVQSLLLYTLGVWYLSDISNNHINDGKSYELELSISFLTVFCIFNSLVINESSWVWTVVCGITISVLWFVFLIGSTSNLHFERYALHPISTSSAPTPAPAISHQYLQQQTQADSSIGQDHGMSVVSDGISIVVWFFATLNAIPSVTPHISMPKEEFPKLFLSIPFITLAIAILTVFFTCSQAPGTYALLNETFPLSKAYAYIFQSTTYSTKWISLPALIYTCIVMLRVTTQRIVSLGASGLLPHLVKLIQYLTSIVHYLGVVFYILPPPALTVEYDGLLSEESSHYKGNHSPFNKRDCTFSRTPNNENSVISHHENKQHNTNENLSTETEDISSTPLSAPLIASHLDVSHVPSSAPGSPQKSSSSPTNNPMSATVSTLLFTISPNTTAICISCVAFVLCVLLRFHGSDLLYSLVMCIVYATLLIGNLTMLTYVQFRKKFDSLETYFINPGKRYTAIYGGSIFSIFIVYTIVKQQREPSVAIGIAIFLLLSTVYYFCSARRSQCFSEEEQRVMFVAYVINANIKSKLRRQSSMTALRRENSMTMLQHSPSFYSLRSQKSTHNQHSARINNKFHALSSNKGASSPSSLASSLTRTLNPPSAASSVVQTGTSSTITATFTMSPAGDIAKDISANVAANHLERRNTEIFNPVTDGLSVSEARVTNISQVVSETNIISETTINTPSLEGKVAEVTTADSKPQLHGHETKEGHFSESAVSTSQLPISDQSIQESSCSREAQKRGSLITWAMSTMSRPRIYSISNVQKIDDENNPHSDQILSDSVVHSVVQDRLRELGRIVDRVSVTSTRNDIAVVNKSRKANGSFSVPPPTKYYRHSLGDVMVTRRRSSLAPSAASSTTASLKHRLLPQVQDPLTIDDVCDEEEPETTTGITYQNKTSMSTRRSHPKVIAEDEEVQQVPTNNISRKPMVQQSSLKSSTIAVQSVSQDEEVGLSAAAAYEEASAGVSPSAMQPNTSSRAKDTTADSHYTVNGVLRRSLDQLTNLASQLLPMVADDVVEFQEYTKDFVETILQDMEQLEDEDTSN